MRLLKNLQRNAHVGVATFATIEHAKAAFDKSGQLKIDGVVLDVVYAPSKKEKSTGTTPTSTASSPATPVVAKADKKKKIIPGE